MKLAYEALEGTNTKTRRLAYLTYIVYILGRRGLSERILLAKLAEWGQQSETWLESYWVKTGKVTSTYRNSAGGRYLHLATNLGLIASISGVYRTTRLGLVLWELIKDNPVDRNPFYLTQAEQLFYTYLLLERDSDVLLTITDYLLEQPGDSLAQIQRLFQSKLIKRLSWKIEISQDEKLKRQLLDRRTEIEKWSKPKRYAEHIVPPRLNWLLDLEMLEPGQFRKHRYFLTGPGEQFFGKVPELPHSQLHDVTDNWLMADFWSIANIFLKTGALIDWDQQDARLQGELTELLAEAFKRFHHTTVPKVSLTQILLYLSIRIILAYRLAVNPTILANWLQSSPGWAGKRYEVRASARENESYLIVVAA